ncbi:uncharacterized protein LOC144904827 [Branchiostoma floridae x Branchiostoma belcheri]
MRFTSDTSIRAAGFYASYTSEVIRDADRNTLGAVVDLGPETLPCPGSSNITGEDLAVTMAAAAFSAECDLREQILLEWESWGNISHSLMQIYENDFDRVNPVKVDDFSGDSHRRLISKGHRIRLSLLLKNKDTDIADDISHCSPAVRTAPDIGIIAMDNHISDTDQHCKVVVKTSTSRRLLTSLDLVSNPSASAQREPHGSRTRVALFNPEGRLLSLSSHTSLPLPAVSSQDELLIVFWSNVANSQWIPEVQYSPTGCQDYSHELIRNGTTVLEDTCGMFKHHPVRGSTNFEYRVRVSVKEGTYLKIVLPPPARFEDIRFMCKQMKSGCEEDLKVYDLHGNSPVLIYSLCRQQNDAWRTVWSSSSTVEVVYSTFCAWSRSGFVLFFEASECPRIQTASCKKRVSLAVPCGSFLPPSHGQASVCEWQIPLPPEKEIVLSFRNLKTNKKRDGRIFFKELQDDGSFRTVCELPDRYVLYSVTSTSTSVLVKYVEYGDDRDGAASFTAFYSMRERLLHEHQSSESEELCEKNFRYYRSNCFRVITDNATVSWETAQHRCTEFGSDLASISNPHEMEYVERLLREEKTVKSDGAITAFIGLMTTGQDVRYAWVDGSQVLFTYWRGRTPLPAGQNTESCALMLTSRTETKWFTVPCNYPEATRTYICKAKARGCTRGWTMAGKSCLRAYPLPDRSTNPARDSVRLCRREDATVATVNSSADVLHVQDYLRHMWPVYPRERVYMNIKYDDTNTCDVLERRHDTDGEGWIVPKTECQFRRPNLVLCSMDVDGEQFYAKQL